MGEVKPIRPVKDYERAMRDVEILWGSKSRTARRRLTLCFGGASRRQGISALSNGTA